MTFLQPLMLLAVPLIALPILIHLINQRRYQTMQWGAMRFLLTANKMSRGYARVRQWFILACRTLAIAGLILAASRPLASGILGLVGAATADTTILLLDRSPSMTQTGGAGTLSKRQAALQQLTQTLQKLSSTHWVLIESDRAQPQKLDSLESLLELPETQASSASANLPTMLEAAAEYIAANKTGRTDIWISSDLRSNDWQTRSGRWQELREQFQAFPQSVRFQLFGFPEPAPDNLAIEVTEVERLDSITEQVTEQAGHELALSLRLTREASRDEAIVVPVQIHIGNAVSQVEIEMVGKEAELQAHRIPIDGDLETGWGKVSLRADQNTADDTYYFTFDKPAPRKTVLVSGDPANLGALQLAAEVPPARSVQCVTESIAPHQVDGVAWEEIALVLWHAPLPQAEHAALLENYVRRGGRIIFFPPESINSVSETAPGDDADKVRSMFDQVSWTAWKTQDTPLTVATWRMDQDLLANSLGGLSLPVGELETYRYCPLQGELTALATLDGGDRLVARLPTATGGVYFCSTTTLVSDSNLAQNGAVLYVAVQRALEAGARELGKSQLAVAGELSDVDLSSWQQRAGSENALSTSFAYQAGVYQQDDLHVAVNYGPDEPHAAVLTPDELQGLFDGLNFSLIQNQVGATSSLVQEIWRTLLVAMIVALLAEAILCVPRRVKPQEEKNSIFRERSEHEAVVKQMQEAAA